MNICDASAIEASILAIANEIECTGQDESQAAAVNVENVKKLQFQEEEQKPQDELEMTYAETPKKI